MKLSRCIKIGLTFAVMFFVTLSIQAAPIDFSIINPDRIAVPGDIVAFDGTITNNTGAALSSTDLFLNFSGFDAINVSLDQLLGLTSFSIPDGTISSIVNLFTFTLASTATAGTYPTEVVLQTAADISDPHSVIVRVVPEPESLLLALTALTLLLLSRFASIVKIGVPVLLTVAMGSQVSMAQVNAVRFVTGQPGLGTSGSTLMVAMPITNNGTVTATNAKVTGVRLRTASLTTPTNFPVTIGTIAPGASSVFQANFNATTLSTKNFADPLPCQPCA